MTSPHPTAADLAQALVRCDAEATRDSFHTDRYRCRYLAQTLQKPILVLVFNRSLAAWMQHQFAAQGSDDNRVKVRTFHKWCHDQLRLLLIDEGHDF